MKRVPKPVFFIVFILTIAVVVLSFVGIRSQFGDMERVHFRGIQDIRWGIDIRGGVDVTFRPPEGHVATQEEMTMARSIIDTRLLSQNITDSEVYVDYDRNRLIVRFPWQEGEVDFNPEVAIRELGEMALLTFREVAAFDPASGAPISTLSDEIILEGRHVNSASVGFTHDQLTGRSNVPVVVLNLNSEGAQRFSEATSRLAGHGFIAIWMDDNMISAPFVQQHIPGGEATISSPTMSITEANLLAGRINSGALPFRLETDNYNSISPTLGAGALEAMMIAGIIAFAAISLFMLIVYRLPGAIAVIALAGQAGLIIASVAVPGFTLTLPGIAGIILSIACGVDANVITAERIKEEIKSGKTLDGAIYIGSKRAFTAIFDGNITMIIVAVVLMGAFGPPTSIFARLMSPFLFMFGPAAAGHIYSFGYTLLMGVIANFIMSVWATRLMMQSISRFSAFRNLSLYGRIKSEVPNVRFIGLAKRFFIGSAAVAIAILATTGILGMQLDIQFRGGAIVSYSYEGALNVAEFHSIAQTATSENVSFQHSTDLASGLETIVIAMPGNDSLDSDEFFYLTAALQEAFPDNNIQTMSALNVNPTIGGEFLARSLVALVVASVLIIIYVALRFKKIGGLSAGIMAIAGLVHDTVIVFGVFIIFQIPINDLFMAVVLTILGYSINDTIVLYDRIRENNRLYGNSKPIAEIVNLSTNQCITRSVNTGITTILAMAIVAVVAQIYGLNSIVTFAFPIVLGLVSGVYSTLCISGPLWVKWKERRSA